MKRLHLVSIILILLVAVSCNELGRRVKGNGNRITQTRDVDDATRIKVSGSFNVVLSKGETAVKVEGDENLLEFVSIKNHDGALEIGTKHNINMQSDRPIVVYITSPEVTEVRMSGSGDVTGNEKFVTTKKMLFKMAGSGAITLSVNTPVVEASISGSGTINLGGETRDLKVSIAGSGNLNAFDLKAENSKVSIAGSGNAYIYSDVNLTASIAGSGVVEYKGNAEVRKSINGSGSIVKR